MVVVPTYNEVDNIEQLVRGIRDVEPGVGIVVVDDASVDGTSAVAHGLAAELGDITVIDRPRKDGLGSAYRAGLAHALDAGADVCVVMDADLSHDPAVISALVANISHGADLAIGSRYVPGGRTERWPWGRRWLSRWGNRYAAGVLGLAVNDATAGFRAYSSDVLRRIQFDTVAAEGYGFQIEMTYRVVRAGGRIVEFPIAFRDRGAGRSKLSRGIVREAFGLVPRLWLADRRDRRRRRRISG
jgi:dolichol-phosphate mannosyltransferase